MHLPMMPMVTVPLLLLATVPLLFQDGATDTVVELVGVIATGVSSVAAVDFAGTSIEIA